MLRSRKNIVYSALLFGTALVILVGTYWYSAVNLTNTGQSADLVAHSYQVKDLIERLSSDVKDAERGERGYLLTEDPYYLNLYHSAIADDERTFRHLRELTADNPAQQKSLWQANSLIQQRLGRLQAILDAQTKGGPEAARAIIRQGKGKRLMQAIETQIQSLQREEDRLLVLRQGQLAQARKQVWYFSAFFFVLSVGLMISGYIYLRQAARRYHQLLVEKNHYAEQVEQSNRTLALVATVASHDLNPLLRKTRFFLDEILKDPASQFSTESRDFFQRMQRSSEKLEVVIEHVLAIARSKYHEIPTESMNLKTVAEEVREALEQQIREARGQVEIQEMCTFSGDKYEIAQLIQNLVENSLKHTRPTAPPVIRISARQIESGGCEIRVEDNGVTANGAQQQNFFRRLGQKVGLKWLSISVDPALTSLRAAYQIIWRHQGSLRLESREGQGSQCIVTLPGASRC